jgi:acyl-CoA synthetase (AMP-forming)/AMP-acid ligase II
LPSLRSVNSGGAPISLVNLQIFNSLLSDSGQTFSSWGATEGLPLATIAGREILSQYKGAIEAGKGSPIGRILHPIEARLIQITDERISTWREGLLVSEGAIGEVIVHGPNVSKSYHMSPESNADHKIVEATPSGSKIWHRTGDLAWKDEKGVLFFTGRKAHSFSDKSGTLMHSVACEGVANAHPKVKQSALVGVDGLPVICLQLLEETDKAGQEKIRSEVLSLLGKQQQTKDIQTILFHRRFPVDLRHNAKIERPRLAIWARHALSPQGNSGAYAKIIPILGWLYIAAGLIIDFPPGIWTWIWWIDLFLSVVVHLAQIPEGVSVGSLHGYTAKQSAWRTFIFGATWWKPLRPAAKK